MPESPEVETERLHETIQEELEKEGSSFMRRIAVTTAAFAAIAAIASLRAGATANEALLLKTEATRFQAQASDQWAYYQAKGTKAAVQEATRVILETLGKPVPERIGGEIARYGQEQQAITAEARGMEQARDEKSAEADHLLHRHHRFAGCVALLQVAIALGALAALTRVRFIWWGSIALGLSGVGLLALAL